MYVCVALPLCLPVTLTGVNSWQGQKSPQHFPLSLSSHFFLLSRVHSSCPPYFSRFFFFSHLAPLQLSLTHLPYTVAPSLYYISGSMGTTSTRSSADVCINQIEGPVMLDDLKARVYVTYTQSSLYTYRWTCWLRPALPRWRGQWRPVKGHSLPHPFLWEHENPRLHWHSLLCR